MNISLLVALLPMFSRCWCPRGASSAGRWSRCRSTRRGSTSWRAGRWRTAGRSLRPSPSRFRRGRCQGWPRYAGRQLWNAAVSSIGFALNGLNGANGSLREALDASGVQSVIPQHAPSQEFLWEELNGSPVEPLDVGVKGRKGCDYSSPSQTQKVDTGV